MEAALLSDLSSYRKLNEELLTFSDASRAASIRILVQTDLFFLLTWVCGRADMWKPWLLERCREVQEHPDGFLDLWSREHYKSTIITYGKTIQDLLVDPNRTFGIFSHTRPMAKDFLRQIKREFETNIVLRSCFPDVIWEKPERDAPKWSEDEGIILKRSSNPKEASVEAWGVVDGQPIGKHFWGLVYDDIVVKQSVTTPEMLAKTSEMVELSYSLGSDGGCRRAIGTRYHFNDAYRTMLDRGSFAPRIRLATDDGTVTGKLAIWSRDLLNDKRRDMGPYTFACFVADTPILMADFTQKRLVDVQIGDEVIGYTFGNGKRAALVPTKVVATNNREALVSEFTFASGNLLQGTSDHKFWHGRAKRDYSVLGLGKRDLQAACKIYDPQTVFAEVDVRAGAYLAGMFDGEGSVSGKTPHIAQSNEKNRNVCDRIETAFTDCKVPFAVCTPKARPGHNDYYVVDGRQGMMRFLHVIGDCAKRERTVYAMLQRATRNIGKGVRDKLVSLENLGPGTVYNIQTETGNYIAGGYAVKNCQIMQNPVADSVMGFKREHLLYYDDDPADLAEGMNVYLLVDAANSKKKGSDYTVMWAVGLNNDNNAYVLDIVRDRMNLTERADRLLDLHRKWKPYAVRYESYGMQGDIEHIQHIQRSQRYRFNIDSVGGQTPKNDRIRRLIPWFENGRIYLPKLCYYRDYEGVSRDMVNTFVEDEYVAFPVSVHDDMLDSLSRLLEPDLPLTWPKGARQPKQRDRYALRAPVESEVSPWYY